MAVAQQTKIRKKKNKKKKKKNNNNKALKRQIFLIFGLLMAVVFLPTTFLLCIAMMPTFVAALVDKAKRKTRAITVGAMNVAGSMPFLLELWMEGHNFEKAFIIATDAKAIIVMYSAAAVGYLIDWAMTGVISGFLLQRGKARVKAIEKRQKELVERWGKEVTGEVAVDNYGFAIESSDE